MQIKIYIMAGNKDLKMKAPMVEDYGSTVEEAFKKGRLETTQHYRAKLFMYKQLQEGLMRNMMQSLKSPALQGNWNSLKNSSMSLHSLNSRRIWSLILCLLRRMWLMWRSRSLIGTSWVNHRCLTNLCGSSNSPS
ncbi:Uncharacterized protein Rs2_41038 [Raphanus sativus]|nr:Uncharacterized protein Rs2_41038 [Raphanus sativus]